MTHTDLSGKTIGILVADGFEASELTEPKSALEAAGATVFVVSPSDGVVQGLKHMQPAIGIPVDIALDRANPEEYHALVLPGGVFNPDQLRTNDKALAFVRSFFAAGKPVAAICHGPQVLINADVVKGRSLTAVEAIRKDLRNAGARVTDEEVVVDDGLITSRTPEDLPVFCETIVAEFADGRRRHVHAV